MVSDRTRKGLGCRLAVASVLAVLDLSIAALATEDGPSAPETDEPQSVERKMEDVDQRLRILERKRELEQEQAVEREKGATQVGAGKDGFFVRSADGAYELRIRGYAQLDGRFYTQDDAGAAVDTFVLRRVRPIFEGKVAKFVQFRVMPDFGEGRSSVQDAYLELHLSDALRIRAGKYKPPVGLERLQSGSDLVFVERSQPTNLVPNRDLGVQVHGEPAGGVVAYAAGVFNGVGDGQSADTDTDDRKEAAARVFVMPFRRSEHALLQGLGLGVAGTRGSHRGTVSAPGVAGYRTAGQLTFFRYESDGTAAGTVVADGRRVRLVPQALYHAGRLGLQAEFVRAKQRVRLGTTDEDVAHEAWQVTASFLLTDDRATWKTLSPKRPFDPSHKARGAVEVAARLGALRVDDAAFPLFADPGSSAREAREWGVGLNWYLSRNTRTLLDYIHTRFDGGSAAGDRDAETVFLSRFQVSW